MKKSRKYVNPTATLKASLRSASSTCRSAYSPSATRSASALVPRPRPLRPCLPRRFFGCLPSWPPIEQTRRRRSSLGGATGVDEAASMHPHRSSLSELASTDAMRVAMHRVRLLVRRKGPTFSSSPSIAGAVANNSRGGWVWMWQQPTGYSRGLCVCSGRDDQLRRRRMLRHGLLG